MKNKIPYTFIATDTSITVYIDGEAYTADNTHLNYNKIVKKIKKGYKKESSKEKLKALFDTTKAVKEYLKDDIKISDTGVLTYKEEIIDNVLTKKIIDMMNNGFNIDPMINFLINLRKNPSKTAQEELMLFMEKNQMPITPDGYLVAYKSVRQDYKDSWTGTFDNSIGSICEMKRNDVDDNRQNTCSSGLHFASKDYAGSFVSNGRLMVLKINPRDIVSIPYDYNNAKGRCCKYEVIDEVPMSTTAKDKYNTKIITDIEEWYTKTDICPNCGYRITDEDWNNGYCYNCEEDL